MTSKATDQILAIVVAIRDCSLIEVWETNFQAHFEAMDVPDKIWSHNAYQSMYRAALLFSLISLRKVADFAENRGDRVDDIRLRDHGIDLNSVTGVTEILDPDTRTTIDKAIAHLTSTHLDPDVDQMETLRKVLAEKQPILKALEDKFFDMIPTVR